MYTNHTVHIRLHFKNNFSFRHKEAIKLNQTLKARLKSNNNYALTITSLLVDGFEKHIPNIMKNNYGRLPVQSVYKKPS